MKTMCLSGDTSKPLLVERVREIPKPGPGEVLVRVHAAGVTPTELQWYPTSHTASGEAREFAVPGHEFSGVVAAHCPEVSGLEVGSAVYGMNDWFTDGATAEYCVTKGTSIALKPKRLSHEEAATVPIGALTAWQGLFTRANLRVGERVLVHGGSGAVGVFAVQLAKRTGAHVITTASARQAAFLTELGAEETIDYRTADFESVARDFDVIFDCVGGATLKRSWQLLKPSGRMVTIASDAKEAQDERTKAAFFIVEPNVSQLAEIAGFFDAGELKAFVDAVVPLADASSAYLGTAVRSHERGKVVVSVAA